MSTQREGADSPKRKKAGATRRGKPGRPPHQPTEELRRRVHELIGISGVTMEGTARILGIHAVTLRKHYAHEIETGRERAVDQVATSLARVASDPTHPRHVDAAKFFLQTRGRWSTRVDLVVDARIENTPLMANLRKLSTERLRQLEEIAGELDGQAEAEAGQLSRAANGAEDGPRRDPR